MLFDACYSLLSSDKNRRRGLHLARIVLSFEQCELYVRVHLWNIHVLRCACLNKNHANNSYKKGCAELLQPHFFRVLANGLAPENAESIQQLTKKVIEHDMLKNGTKCENVTRERDRENGEKKIKKGREKRLS